jgi:exodeoxyribonuclease V alpha subunit
VKKATFELRDVDGFGSTLCERVWQQFPKEEWRSAPYALARVRGVGFRRADLVAAALGVGKGSPERLNAGAWHVLGEAEQHGNTCLPTVDFGGELGACLQMPLPTSLPLNDDDFIEENGLISRTRTTQAERVIAEQTQAMYQREVPKSEGMDSQGLWSDQREALGVIQRTNIFLLLGSPGTGKTHVIRRIAENENTLLCCPTGKGAKRIEELSGLEATTVHRMLGVIHEQSSEWRDAPAAHSGGFRFRHNRKHPLDTDLVICDEASMLDVRLFADLLEALAPWTRLILVGDPFQLPSVGPGAVLRDLLASGAVPNVELTQLKRQDPKLLIARNCSAIRFEKRVIVDNQAALDFYFLGSEKPEETQQMIVEFATKRLPEKYGLTQKEIMVLAPLRDKGLLSVKALNVALRAQLNPEAQNYAMPWTGDRVIQHSNNYELDVMNGDVGTVLEATVDKLTIQFETPEREIEAKRSDFNIELAYALTVHKAQGSEFPATIVVMDGSGSAQYLADAQLTYTAISRAREVCMCIGSRRALDAQVARHRAAQRWTRLGKMIAA